VFPGDGMLGAVGRPQRRPEHDRRGGGGEHLPGHTQEAAGLGQGQLEVAGGGRQPGDHDVAEGVSLQLPGVEAMLEGLAPHGAGVGQGDEALAQVAGRCDPERRSQPAARPAVVGD
jgi:hypothetical protein